MSPDGSDQRNLTNDTPSDDFWPAWSPDSGHIAFAKLAPPPPHQIYAIHSDGSDPTDLSNDPTFQDTYPAWSPLGTRIAFARIPTDGPPAAAATSGR